MQRFIKAVGKGKEGARDLSLEEAREAAQLVVDGASSDAQTAAFLMAVRVKGEASVEIAAFAEVLRARTLAIAPLAGQSASLVDCAGPHDGRRSFAATIPVAVLCAAAGLPTLLHASPSLPPKLGCSLEDILQVAGQAPLGSPGGAEEDLHARQIAYYSAEVRCPPLALLRRLREDIGVRTLLNTAEKFLNAGGARRLLVGVQHQSAVDRLAAMPLPEGVDSLVLVQGLDGSEDLPVHKPSSAFFHSVERRGHRVDLSPADLHLEADPRKDYTVAQQAELIERVLAGEEHPGSRTERHLVLFNTAFRLWAFGGRPSIEQGLSEALLLLKNGKGLSLYLNWLRRPGLAANAA